MYTTEAFLVNTKPGLRNIPADKENITTSTGAVIGGILGACFILTVSTVLIVCKIRSKGIFNESDKHENRETSQLHFSKTSNRDLTNTTKGTSTALASTKTNDSCEMRTLVYSAVHNINKPENMNETYTDAANGEYEFLHDKHNRRICPPDNVYHIQGEYRNEDDLTYDSASFRKGNCNDGNELYDTSFSVVEGDYSFVSYKKHDPGMTTDIYDKST
ncbi:uncharacterized protein LOC127699911 [Mytilus californianus]|uniref:uncharacterized protein LOC127699911 n=1 Tax=Mytilus californianus TaxID=6549 RepID=UPI002247ADFC|nr:uncharacterized protein LOC127699911 [Mytilus californianus]